MTTTERQPARSTSVRRQLAPEVRQAAARMVIAASKANGKTPDQRIVDIAEGKTSPPA